MVSLMSVTIAMVNLLEEVGRTGAVVIDGLMVYSTTMFDDITTTNGVITD